MIYEAQSRETISDSLKIGCVVASMGQNSTKEHLLMSATTCDRWTNFVREIESKETVTSAGSMDTLRKNIGGRTIEGAEKPQCAQCGNGKGTEKGGKFKS